MDDQQEISSIIACTHNGIFHSDEVLACALLRLAAGKIHVSIIRSRLPKDWERSDYVIDVGGKNDGVKWFDHHQLEGGGKRENGLAYSAFGLVWGALGITAIRELLNNISIVELTEAEMKEVYDAVQPFVMAIDAHDQASLNVSAKHSVDKSLQMEVVSVQGVISGMNCIPMIERGNEMQNTAQFYKALDFATEFLRRFILRKASKVLAYAYTTQHIRDVPILVLPEYCDWHNAVSKAAHILYVVYPAANGKSYAVQAVKKGGGQSSTDNLRKPFPAEWAGLDSVALSKLTGVESALFCHRDRFIASASTLCGAIQLANKSIQS